MSMMVNQSNTDNSKVTVPEELRRLLLDFTVSYLLDQPTDLLTYAADYFGNLKDKEHVKLESGSGSSEDFSLDEDAPPVPSIRRKSVFAEAYNPEEDDDESEDVKIYPKSDIQRQRLADSVRNILLFRALDPEQMNMVINAMFEKPVKNGEFIIKQGDDGDNFYVIDSGIYQAYIKTNGTDKLIHTYENKGSFGELALMYNMPRAATIKSAGEGLLWAMDRQTFRRIVLKSAFKKRQMYEHLIDEVPMLKALQSYERMNLADALIPRSYSEGECIIKQGDAADGMYFVESGTVSIRVRGEDGNQVEVSRIMKGGYFGELALVTHKPRAASAYAVGGNATLAFLDVEAFERLLGPCMQIMKRNIDDYETQLVKIFGSKQDISDIR